MERIKELNEEANKIATQLLREDMPEAGHVYNDETRLKAMEVYALLISAEKNENKISRGDNNEY